MNKEEWIATFTLKSTGVISRRVSTFFRASTNSFYVYVVTRIAILFLIEQHINFQSHNTPTFSLPYDFESVMHFKSNELAIVNEIWTIRPREEYSKHQIGQRKRMSQLDIARINKLYECSDRQNNSLDTTAKITGVPKPLA